MITTNIRKWGNSQGICIPKSVLDEVDWKENETVSIYVEGESITLKKAPQKITIEKLFEDYSGGYKPSEVDWGTPVGREIW